MWSVEGAPGDATTGSRDDVDAALRWIAAHRSSAEPWQRGDASVAHQLELGEPLEGVSVPGSSGRRAAAVVRRADGRSAVLQAAVAEPGEATTLLDAVCAGVASVVWLNLPADDVMRDAIAARAGEPVARQLELSLSF